ncbi:hypothetical protein L1049_005703 [Liquidambar formosana]|uniref:Micronuclear linker histone polyprotein-like protein n=1 Tax=Liquidambar formosana TaxID=63359 RepID=A0AAP0WPZ0_LIQFO
MKDRGKAVETFNDNYLTDYYSSSDLPCRKHPSSSSVGICAICLKDRLIKLVCSDCGEQRLSSCSCSEISSNRNSCTVEVGSVGRISFLIENERGETPHSNSKPKIEDKAEEVFLLKRSSSSHVEIKRSNGFWRFGRLFRKKRDKGFERSVGGFDDNKSDLWVLDYLGVPRSRSLCSFRGGGLHPSEDGGDMSVSAARSSSVNCGLPLDPDRKSGFSEERKSGFSEERKSGFSETEPRKSGFDGEKKDNVVLGSENGLDFKGAKKGRGLLELDAGFNGAKRRIYTLKESDFNGLDESGFIDLKLDLSSQSKPEFSAVKMSDLSASDLGSGFATSLRGGSFHEDHECGGSFRSSVGEGILNKGGSCRITLSDIGTKKSRRSLRVWRWIFRHHPSCRSAKKKDEEDHTSKP